MISLADRKQILIFVVVAAVVGFIGVEMFYSLAPPRHADHDHAMASLDAGGFLRIRAYSGPQRNLVGRPGRVLILHFFDPAASSGEQAKAVGYAESVSNDPSVDVLFVARASSSEELDVWVRRTGLSTEHLYYDEEGRTSTLLGVRRWPETLVYDPKGLLAFQAKGPVDWLSPGFQAAVSRAKAGTKEID